MVRKPNSSSLFIEVDGSFITKPFDIANNFNDNFTGKVDKLRSEMTTLNSEPSYLCIEDLIMKEKDCCFEFGQVCVEEVEKPFSFISNDNTPGIVNLYGKLLRMVAYCIATPICHAFNESKNECQEMWKEAKVIPLLKNSKAPFAGSNNRPISLLPVFSKLMEKIVFEQL
jgi:hypothetical protein